MNYQRNNYYRFQTHVFTFYSYILGIGSFQIEKLTWILSSPVLSFLSFSLSIYEINVTMFSMTNVSELIYFNPSGE